MTDELEERNAIAATLDLLVAITALAIGREERAAAAAQKSAPSSVPRAWWADWSRDA